MLEHSRERRCPIALHAIKLAQHCSVKRTSSLDFARLVPFGKSMRLGDIAPVSGREMDDGIDEEARPKRGARDDTARAHEADAGSRTLRIGSTSYEQVWCLTNQ